LRDQSLTNHGRWAIRISGCQAAPSDFRNYLSGGVATTNMTGAERSRGGGGRAQQVEVGSTKELLPPLGPLASPPDISGSADVLEFTGG
jgi:hypothetical protein